MEHYSLFRKDKCTAGEREGGKPPRFIRLFDKRSEIFCENLFLQKMWRF